MKNILLTLAVATTLNAEEDRNEQWQAIWNKKGQQGQTTSKPLYEIDGYDAVQKTTWEKTVRSFIKKLTLKPGITVCDFGCGSGAIIEQLLVTCPNLNVYGCDYAEQMVAVAKQSFPHSTFWVQNITESLPQAISHNLQVDVALCCGVFPYLNSSEDAKRAICNMATIVKKGGRIFISDINGIEKQDLAESTRKESHSPSKHLVPGAKLDHLFLSKELFIDLANELGAKVEFVGYEESNYAMAPYRFNVLLTL